jgi:hypothetical protein
MTLVKRRLFRILAVTSLVLGLTVSALSVRSFWLYDGLFAGHLALESGRGKIGLKYVSPFPYYDNRLLVWETGDAMPIHYDRIPLFKLQRHIAPAQSGEPWWRWNWQFWMPTWLVAIVFFLASYGWSRSTHRPAPGLCPICGYDLRATPDRCPECGTIPAKPIKVNT